MIIGVLLRVLARLGGTGVTDSAGAMTGPNALGVLVSIVVVVYGLAAIIPNLAVSIRRLHDANSSGFFILLGFIPIVGGLIILVLMLLPSNPQGQRFDGAF